MRRHIRAAPRPPTRPVQPPRPPTRPVQPPRPPTRPVQPPRIRRLAPNIIHARIPPSPSPNTASASNALPEHPPAQSPVLKQAPVAYPPDAIHKIKRNLVVVGRPTGTQDFEFLCPHCILDGVSDYEATMCVAPDQINCKIFRHGHLVQSGQQIPPHTSRRQCDSLMERGLATGCARPVYFDGVNVLICGYI